LGINEYTRTVKAYVQQFDNIFEFQCVYYVEKPILSERLVIDSKVKIIGHENIHIEAMTIHKAKGLTSDQVIIIGLNEKFPSNDKPKFWLENLFISEKQIEPIEYAEERRVFYVALTRTKNNVYILVNKDKNHRSKFVNEIFKITKEKK